MSSALLTEKEVSKMLRLSLPTLRRRRGLRKEPRFVRIGSAVRYLESDIEAFVDSLLAAGATEGAAA